MTFVSISGNVLTVKDSSGKQIKKTLADNVSVMLNGQPARKEDLQDGYGVSLIGDPVTSISASR